VSQLFAETIVLASAHQYLTRVVLVPVLLVEVTSLWSSGGDLAGQQGVSSRRGLSGSDVRGCVGE